MTATNAFGTSSMPIILASNSGARKAMLTSAAVPFTAISPMADEDAIKAGLMADGAPARDIAHVLAEAKAMSLSALYPDAVIIGSDQLLVHDGKILSKVTGRGGAAAKLASLQGQTHHLLSAVVMVIGGKVEWRHHEIVKMVMHSLDAGDIDAYLDAVVDAAYSAVGCYQLEALGARLFARVEGDYFSVLGMPLLAVLTQLRLRGILHGGAG